MPLSIMSFLSSQSWFQQVWDEGKSVNMLTQKWRQINIVKIRNFTATSEDGVNGGKT